MDREGRVRPVRRALAVIVICAFLAVVVGTTARSLGGYCLTSDGGNTARLPGGGPSQPGG